MTQAVLVRHDAALSSPAALVAALNGAMLDASLTPPRAQAQVRCAALRCRPGAGRAPASCAPAARCPARPLAPHCPAPSCATIPRRSALQASGRWLPPWRVLAGALLLAASLLHCVAGAAAWLPAGLARLEPLSLGAVALCLPRIARRAALALRRGVSPTACCTLGGLALLRPACALLHAVARRQRRPRH